MHEAVAKGVDSKAEVLHCMLLDVCIQGYTGFDDPTSAAGLDELVEIGMDEEGAAEVEFLPVACISQQYVQFSNCNVCRTTKFCCS